MIDRLLNGPKWVLTVIFAITILVIGGLAYVVIFAPKESTQTSTPTQPVTQGPLLPSDSGQVPTALPTPTAVAPSITTPSRGEPIAQFPMTDNDLNSAARAAIDFQIAANSYTFETTAEEYLFALNALAFDGSAAGILGDGTPGPLGLDASEATAQKLSVEGRAEVMDTILVTPDSATFLVGTTADVTRSGETTRSATITQQIAVQRDGSQWKVLSVSDPVETFGVGE